MEGEVEKFLLPIYIKMFDMIVLSFSQPEYNVFVADLSRDVTSAMLLVGWCIITVLLLFNITNYSYRNTSRSISSLSDMPEVGLRMCKLC